MALTDKYASSILRYSIKNSMNFKTYTENLAGEKGIRIHLTNNWGVPDTAILAKLFLFNDRIYYKESNQKEGRGLVKYLKEKFPEKVKRMERDF